MTRLPRLRDPAIDSRTFTCFRLVPNGDHIVPLQVYRSHTRMFIFTRI